MRTTGGLALVAGVLGLVPLGAVQASCAAPALRLTGVAMSGGTGPAPAEPLPAVVLPSAPTPAVDAVPLLGAATVTGAHFQRGCDDTGHGKPGCGARPSGTSPRRGVDLVLEQGTTTATVGTADATATYEIVWQVRPPAGFGVGPAVLRAGGAALPVQLVR